MSATHGTQESAKPSKPPPFFSVQARRDSAFFSSARVQAKLSIGAPGDAFEREADSMADRVVQRKLAGPVSAVGSTVQAKCSACQHEEEKVQRQILQASGQESAGSVPGSVEQHLHTGHAGHSLPPPLQAQMEEAFQSDFSSVRIHTGGHAEQLNRELNARAFTHGSNIYFNAGEFNPGSQAGQHLLAHELTHVVQQSGGQATQVQRACGAPAIGAPVGCKTHLPIFLDGYPTFKFSPNCDTFASGQKAAMVAHASGLPATAQFEVHGYSSSGGDATFNQNLSCARALEARTALTDAPPAGAGIAAARISDVFAHGGTPGSPAASRSSVVLTPPRPTPLPTAVPAAGATDFAIKRVGDSTNTRIFFAADSDALDTDAKIHIDALKGTAPGSVRVNGFVSVGEADAVAQSRANAVKARLKAAPHAVTVTAAVGVPDGMKATSDFVEARSVEIVVGAAAPAKLDCSAQNPVTHAPINPPTQGCAAMDPATDTAFKAAHPIAKEAMSKAVTAVTGTPDAVAAPLIDRFFGNHSASTLTTLRTNLGKLQTNVNALDSIVQCGGQCDTGGCDRGPIAYHSKVGETPVRMVLCVPAFKGLPANDQPRNLIHETAHGTEPLGGGPGKGTEDVAYRHERMLFHLSTVDRLRNSDSYALFAMFLREAKNTGVASAVPAGIGKPHTDTITGISASDQPALELALAVLEKRLSWCEDLMSQGYGELHKVRTTPALAWADSWANDLMTEVAKRFPLTAPPAKPTVTDQTRFAGILDRYIFMKAAGKRDLSVTGAATGGVTWATTSGLMAGKSLTVGPEFFRAVPRDQVALLLESLARATKHVEPAFVPAYVTLAEWIHSQNP